MNVSELVKCMGFKIKIDVEPFNILSKGIAPNPICFSVPEIVDQSHAGTFDLVGYGHSLSAAVKNWIAKLKIKYPDGVVILRPEDDAPYANSRRTIPLNELTDDLWLQDFCLTEIEPEGEKDE